MYVRIGKIRASGKLKELLHTTVLEVEGMSRAADFRQIIAQLLRVFSVSGVGHQQPLLLLSTPKHKRCPELLTGIASDPILADSNTIPSGMRNFYSLSAYRRYRDYVLRFLVFSCYPKIDITCVRKDSIPGVYNKAILNFSSEHTTHPQPACPELLKESSRK